MRLPTYFVLKLSVALGILAGVLVGHALFPASSLAVDLFAIFVGASAGIWAAIIISKDGVTKATTTKGLEVTDVQRLFRDGGKSFGPSGRDTAIILPSLAASRSIWLVSS